LIGLNVEVADDADVNAHMMAGTSIAALHLGGTTAKMTSLRPTNRQEAIDSVPVLLDAADALLQGGKSVRVTQVLNDFLTSERAKPGAPMKAVGKSMEFAGKFPSRLYQIGTVYVVIEGSENSAIVSVFPSVPLVVK
jgi:hypothetical protein